MKICTVIVNPGNRISQVAYDSLEKAQKFIEGRGDNPKKVSSYKYKSDMYEYLIHDLIIE